MAIIASEGYSALDRFQRRLAGSARMASPVQLNDPVTVELNDTEGRDIGLLCSA
ncbi:hypothetical protein FHX15_002859 [Rhizobium sp. BK650]|uniref:hypothetical protein n=1 Tax=Rhizobium sp. BK650 TaxID=2586990 RepID=UPI00160C343F|nr:hypothetical protein [Rhizobium sp. BK650]MBB3657617.1 hypothetical protein [Rhizobium sp. BK650]